jgi:hypothetical protein
MPAHPGFQIRLILLTKFLSPEVDCCSQQVPASRIACQFTGQNCVVLFSGQPLSQHEARAANRREEGPGISAFLQVFAF